MTVYSPVPAPPPVTIVPEARLSHATDTRALLIVIVLVTMVGLQVLLDHDLHAENQVLRQQIQANVHQTALNRVVGKDNNAKLRVILHDIEINARTAVSNASVTRQNGAALSALRTDIQRLLALPH